MTRLRGCQSTIFAATAVVVVLASCFILGALSYHPSHDIMYTHPQSYDPYSYGFDVEDNYGNKQWRSEKSHNPHEVHGSYGYRDHNGVYREVIYVADKDGFRANIKTNEPGLAGGKDPAGVKLESYYQVPTTGEFNQL